ncbi:hypothetical protein CR513_37500, partial [Mucuna pruriens]
MSNKPSMNGVTERQNWTFKDMGYMLYNPTSKSYFDTGIARFLEQDEFEKKESIWNVIFEEEYVNNIDQVLVPITVQETTSVTEDNVQIIVLGITPEQHYDEVLLQTPIEQPQQP